MEVLRTTLNRRYRAHFDVTDVSMSQIDGELPQARWLTYECTLGRIGFSVDRRLALAILAYRYGAAGKMPGEGEDLPPETVSEERLVSNLGQQFAELLAGCVEMRHGAPAADAERVTHALVLLTPGTPTYGKWIIKATITESTLGIGGALCLTLDEAWMTRLLHNIAPLHKKPHDSFAEAPVAASQIPLTIVARLLQKEIQLGNLLDLHVGEIIPISMNDADVLVDDSRLFTATVAEHKGKLCLTCFEDAK